VDCHLIAGVAVPATPPEAKLFPDAQDSKDGKYLVIKANLVCE
jgi:hypothetical protein